jgi:hypothetical protein
LWGRTRELTENDWNCYRATPWSTFLLERFGRYWGARW